MITAIQRTLTRALLLATGLLPTAHPLRAQATIGTTLTTSVGPFTRAADGFQSFGQSFVAPAFAPRLATFSLSFSSFFEGGVLTFDAYLYAFDAASRRVTGSALWTTLGVPGSSNDFGFDTRRFVTGGLTLAPGLTYLFLVTTSNRPVGGGGASNLVGATASDAYADGALWVASNGGDLGALFAANAFGSVDGASDAAFAAEFLPAATVVPEPATVLLTALGLAGVALVARRRHTRA